MAQAAAVKPSANVDVEKLFELGAHLGHRKSRVHPKSYRYIYKLINGVSIIDLTKTSELIEEARKAIKAMASEGKKPLVVATKKNISQYAAIESSARNISFTTAKWMPGLLTNFDEIIKNARRLAEMKDQSEQGKWDGFVKHERVKLSKELFKLERFYKGLVSLSRLPDFLIVVDARKEKNAIAEARKNRIPVIAIVDTNTNPEDVDYPIVMNDDSQEVVEYVLSMLLDDYSSSYKEPQADEPAEVAAPASPADTKPEQSQKKETKESPDNTQEAEKPKKVEKAQKKSSSPKTEKSSAKKDEGTDTGSVEDKKKNS